MIKQLVNIFKINLVWYVLILAMIAMAVDWSTVHDRRGKYLLGIFYNGYFENCRDGDVYRAYLQRIGLKGKVYESYPNECKQR